MSASENKLPFDPQPKQEVLVRARFINRATNKLWSWVRIEGADAPVAVYSNTLVSATEYAKAALDSAEQPEGAVVPEAAQILKDWHEVRTSAALGVGLDSFYANRFETALVRLLRERVQAFRPTPSEAQLRAALEAYADHSAVVSTVALFAAVEAAFKTER